jgi:rhodanese-related sulfurtransferase
VSEVRRVLRQALILGVLSVLAAAAVHHPLIKRYARGEFRESFFQASEHPGVRLITLAEAEELWRTQTAIFFDARPTPLYGDGHVPGSRNVPAAESAKTLAAEVLALAREGTIVVYCEGGDCQSSLSLARRLHDESFDDVRVFMGGWEEWEKAGLPREKRDGQE